MTEGDRNPLGDVLRADAGFFELGGLTEDGHVRWFDERDSRGWTFTASPLPRTPDAYIRYLDNVLDFVSSRNGTIAAAADFIS